MQEWAFTYTPTSAPHTLYTVIILTLTQSSKLGACRVQFQLSSTAALGRRLLYGSCKKKEKVGDTWGEAELRNLGGCGIWGVGHLGGGMGMCDLV